jgi:hypothetical protein
MPTHLDGDRSPVLTIGIFVFPVAVAVTMACASG